ncbi:uncharacterized protein LOC125479521 [Pyrus x bretschneideri]|uniref:uncharacterized protein LOC125479521 n=1 Tax=Pyrus x bretschneideri TaxID=225117 RepID=UPI00202E6859|nr:uncharacterized protein LOC125479521 [Pyrus x bretschneideri]
MKMMLQGHGIMGFIDGSNPCPPQYTATSTHSVIIYESFARPELDEFKVWKMHDHALMLLLTATLSSSAISYVIGSKSSQEMWVRLQNKIFLPITRTSIITLKTDLYNIKKGSDSISQYLRRIIEARDALSILGVTFPNEDIVIIALIGHPVDYNTFKCVIRGRENVISLEDFHAQLLTEEAIVDCVPMPPFLSAVVSKSEIKGKTSFGMY